jgi:hypothetical protein
MQGEDELDLGVILEDVHEALLGRAGVPEDIASPIRQQLLHQRALAGHSRHASTPLSPFEAEVEGIVPVPRRPAKDRPRFS